MSWHETPPPDAAQPLVLDLQPGDTPTAYPCAKQLHRVVVAIGAHHFRMSQAQALHLCGNLGWAWGEAACQSQATETVPAAEYESVNDLDGGTP